MVQSLSTVAAPQLENKTPEQDEEESQNDQGILNRGIYDIQECTMLALNNNIAQLHRVCCALKV